MAIRKTATAPAPEVPDATLHNPDPGYLRDLLARAGLSQRKAAERIGVTDRAMRYYLAGDQDAPYPVQFSLERLAAHPQLLRVADSVDGPIQRTHGKSELADGWYWFHGETYDVPNTGTKFRVYVMGDETLVGGRRYSVHAWKGHAKIYGPVPEGEREEPRGTKGWKEF